MVALPRMWTVRSNALPKRLLFRLCKLADTLLKIAGIDSSDRLYTLLRSLGDNPKELLAEFQVSFVVFLIGQVYEGFEQWKRLIHLMCSCNRALVTHSQFFLDLLMVIHFQLKQCPEDFFHDQLAKDNFLWANRSSAQIEGAFRF
ncbi:AAR2 protein domain-containing protein [Ditylenchus destructor]|uniref:AAR2 protein domain-containing protein n=1 Tax=Ditylenchus destructor TaxID=166010 RepID=A0AAD4MVG0_9BILA|nr:AAR2 protein domain-containing protein [Ditylenchus destructor]